MRKVVFMIGSGHSGSTLLSLVLGSHSTAFALGEFWSVGWRIDQVVDRTPSMCGICADECPFWSEPSRLSVLRSYFGGGSSRNWLLSKLNDRLGAFRGNIYGRLFEWSGADVLIDSTKAKGWSRRQLRPFWFWREVTPFLIYITRDGRAVASSYLRKYPDRDMAFVAESWAKGMLRREQYFRTFPENRRLRVAYEELATKPGEVMRSVCGWLGVTYEPEMLRYWQHDHHIVAGNLGTRSLIFRWRERFDDGEVGHGMRVDEVDDRRGDAYYDQVGLAIGLDMRWTRELGAEQLEVFEAVAGKVNERYAWPGGE
jgi:hypothetical protein